MTLAIPRISTRIKCTGSAVVDVFGGRIGPFVPLANHGYILVSDQFARLLTKSRFSGFTLNNAVTIVQNQALESNVRLSLFDVTGLANGLHRFLIKDSDVCLSLEHCSCWNAVTNLFVITCASSLMMYFAIMMRWKGIYFIIHYRIHCSCQLWIKILYSVPGIGYFSLTEQRIGQYIFPSQLDSSSMDKRHNRRATGQPSKTGMVAASFFAHEDKASLSDLYIYCNHRHSYGFMEYSKRFSNTGGRSLCLLTTGWKHCRIYMMLLFQFFM